MQGKRKRTAICLTGFLFMLPALLHGQDTVSTSLVQLVSKKDGAGKSGTGFVVAVEGRTAFIVTAAHVVEGERTVEALFPLDRSRPYEGEVLQNDPREDLALLRVVDAPREVQALSISVEPPTFGDFVNLMGFPRRAFVPRHEKATLASREGTRLVLSDCQVNDGSSGSPVMQGGRVIGMIVVKETQYPEAIPGPTLRQALASWLPERLLPEPRVESSEILGRVFWIAEDGVTRHYEEGVSIRVLETEGSAVTDEAGFFRLASPPDAALPAGRDITLVAGKKGWVIRYPRAGITRVPALPAAEILEIELVPEGSKTLLAHDQIEERIELQIKEAVERAAREPTRYIEEWAASIGFGIEEVRQEVDRWSDKVLAHSEDAHKRGLAEYAKSRFVAAQESFDQAAQGWRDELEAVSVEKQQLLDREAELQRRLVRDLELAGSSAFEARRFEIAIERYREALAFSSRETNDREWAKIQNSLGNALQGQGRHTVSEEGERLLAAAVTAYRAALEVRTRDRLPQQWAGTQNNLGVALQEQGKRSGGDEGPRLLAAAVAAFDSALEVFSRDQLPQEWAMTQSNLGKALLEQGNRIQSEEGVRLLAAAVTAFHGALEVLARDQFPQPWAGIQNGLGNALSQLGIRQGGEEGTRLLAAAVTAYRAALEVTNRNLFPQDWATSQNGLGVALSQQGSRTSFEEGTRLLASSVAAFRAALGVFTRDDLPQRWAMAQTNLGSALSDQGTRTIGEEGTRLLASSVAAHRAALEVFTLDQFPQEWAATQTNLGNALSEQGRRIVGKEGTRLLASAVVAHRAALKVRTRDHQPLDWAMTQNNLGIALSDQGIRTIGEEGTRLLASSVSAYLYWFSVKWKI